MGASKVKGIVLGGTNVKDKDKLLTLFTLEKGKITASMRGVRGDKAKLKSAKDIFTFGDFVLEEGKNSNIVTAVDVIDNFYGLSQNIEKYYEACAIIDIVSKVATEEANPQLFIEIVKSLKALCYTEVKKYYVINKFLLSIFDFMGYRFVNDKCSECGASLDMKYLNLNVGELVCPACRDVDAVQLSNACFSALKLLENTDYEKLPTIKFGGMGEVQAFNILCKNFEYRTGFSVLDMV